MKDLKNSMHLTVNQLNLIDALREKPLSIDELKSLRIVDDRVIMMLITTLVTKGVVDFSDNIVTLKNASVQRLKLKGNLNLPVSSFVDERGQRWVIRGTYHKIEDDTDITSIEWIEDMQTNSKVQELLEKAKSRKEKAAAAKNIFADDPPAEYGIDIKDRWVNVNHEWKLWIGKLSGIRAKIVIAPRIFSDANVEFPWGGYESSPIIIDIETLKLATENGDISKILTDHVKTHESFFSIPSKYVISMTGDTFEYIAATSGTAETIVGTRNTLTVTESGKVKSKKVEDFSTSKLKEMLENNAIFKEYVMNRF